MDQTPEYTVVRATPENIGDLSRLFLENSGKQIAPEFLREKFNTAYTGKSYFAHFAYAKDGSPAAFFCVFPCLLSINGKQVLAGQSADIITHKNHQRKGLFGLLGKATQALAISEGMTTLFAFPNEQSFPGFIRSLQWKHSGQFKVFSFPVKGIPLFRIAHKLKLSALYHLWTKLVLPKQKAAHSGFNASTSTSENHAWRTEGFYAYKHYNPSLMFHWKGLNIWAKIESSLVIGDIEVSVLKNEEVITRLTQLCRYLGCDRFYFEVSEGSYWEERWKKDVEATEGVSIVYKNLVLEDQSLRIDFTGADTDVF